MAWDYMRGDMARRFDAIFPESGGLEHLAQVRTKFAKKLGDTSQRAGSTFFHPQEVEHVRKVLTLLGDDEEAKATIMSVMAFAQMKNDVASF